MHAIIHIDYLPSKQTINGDYYAALLDRFNNILKKKCTHFGKEKSALLSRQCTGSYAHHQWPNSTNSTTNCFPIQHRCARFSSLRLFPEEMIRKRFATREQLIAEIEAYFEELDKSYYSNGLKKLENRWI